MAQFSYLSWLGLALSPLYLIWTTRPESLLRSAVKILPLTCFGLASYLGGGPVFLTLALFFAGLGDLALSRTGRTAFLYGLSAFALSHIIFVLLFQNLGGVAPWSAFTMAPILAVSVLALAASTELWLIPHTGALRWPVRFYVAVIALMGLAALALGDWIITIGAAAFMASDMILSLFLFRLGEEDPRRRYAAWALWVLYIAAVALIFQGVMTR